MAGRPTVRSDEINRKIEEAAALGASIDEIAFYCGINRATLYRWMEEDEGLKDRIRELQQHPILKARQTIVKSLDQPQHAQWYLERKRKAEFSPRQELTGEDGGPLQHNLAVEFVTNKDTDSTAVPVPVPEGEV